MPFCASHASVDWIARSIWSDVREKSYGDPTSGHHGCTTKYSMLGARPSNSLTNCRAIRSVSACSALARAPIGRAWLAQDRLQTKPRSLPHSTRRRKATRRSVGFMAAGAQATPPTYLPHVAQAGVGHDNGRAPDGDQAGHAPRLQGDPVQTHDRVTTTPQMINDQSPRLMAMARIQGTGEEYRMIGTSCLDWAMVVPSDLVAGSKTLSVTA
jgi:hypothetical protein